MWHLIKAELRVNWISLFLLFSVFITVFAAFMVLGLDDIERSFPAMRVVMLTVAAIVYLIRILRISKDKIDRFHTQLPVPVLHVAFVRILVPNILWFVMLVILLAGILLSRPSELNGYLIWQLAASTGFVMVAYAVPLIYRDLTNIFDGAIHKYTFLSIYALSVVAGYMVFLILILEPGSNSLFGMLTPLQNNELLPGSRIKIKKTI